MIDEFAPDGSSPDEWDVEGMHKQLFTIFPVPEHITPETLAEVETLTDLEDMIFDAVEEAYEKKTQELGEDVMRRAERLVMLSSIDAHWRRHLTDLDVLREGIGLMAIAQRDPLVEYKREAFEMWEDLQEQIHAQAARNIFRVQVNAPQTTIRKVVANVPTVPGVANVQNVQASRPGAVADSKPEPVRRTSKEMLGRNDPCWCGSGKKYKNCHLKADQRGENRSA